MKIKKIHHRYEKFELEIEDIDIPQNTIVGLVGANGAGKTTMMYLLSGIKRANVAIQTDGIEVNA